MGHKQKNRNTFIGLPRKYIIENIKKGKNFSLPLWFWISVLFANDLIQPSRKSIRWLNWYSAGSLEDKSDSNFSFSLSLLSIDPIATSQNSRSLDWISHDRIPIVLFFFIAYFFSFQRGSDIVTPLNSDRADINIINKTDSTNLLFELMVGEN